MVICALHGQRIRVDLHDCVPILENNFQCLQGQRPELMQREKQQTHEHEEDAGIFEAKSKKTRQTNAVRYSR